MADSQYDDVIVGSGPGGYVAGIRAGQLGLMVAVIEKAPFLGGTCLHRGCIPTKSLLENADIWQKIQKSKEFGITVGDVRLDWAAVQTRKQGVVHAEHARRAFTWFLGFPAAAANAMQFPVSKPAEVVMAVSAGKAQ